MKDSVVGQRIKILRTARKMTQLQLANAVGISYQSIADYENCRRIPTGSALVRLEQFFGVNGACIFGLEPIPEPRELPTAPEHKPMDIHFVSEHHPIRSIHSRQHQREAASYIHHSSPWPYITAITMIVGLAALVLAVALLAT